MRVYFIVGAKLLGIYILYLSLLTIFAVIASFIIFLQSSSDPFAMITMVSSAGSLSILLTISAILLFKTDRLAGILKLPEDAEHELNLSLRTGIILIGIYIFSTNIGRFLTTIYIQLKHSKKGCSTLGTVPHGLTVSKDLITGGITIGFSIALIFGSRFIENMVRQKAQKNII